MRTLISILSGSEGTKKENDSPSLKFFPNEPPLFYYKILDLSYLKEEKQAVSVLVTLDFRGSH
jgi:hypothetical protein